MISLISVLCSGLCFGKGCCPVSLERIGIIAIGMVAMMLLMVARRKKYQNASIWKMMFLGFLLTVAGVAGTMLMFYIETGLFGGTSFFGAVLFVPVLILPALLLKLSYKDILNLCASSECLMLAIMKLDCLATDCCIGKYIPSMNFQFPSQIVEMIAGLLVMAALLLLEERKPGRHMYAWYLVLYGAVRFLLNGFRYGLEPFVWILPNGHFWALVSVLIGLLWLACAGKIAAKRTETV